MARRTQTPTSTAVAVAVVAVAAAAAALCLSPSAATAAAAAPPPPTAADAAVAALLNHKARGLVTVAAAARRALTDASRCAAGAQCPCSQSSCARAMPDTLTCSDRLGPEARVCADVAATPGSCTARKLDYTAAYVHVAPGLLDAAGRTDRPALAEDICATRGLGPAFAAAAGNSSGPWTFFAAASGALRLFPGAPLQPGADYTRCARYDPRVRPWYVAAAGGGTDVVILVDASAAMRAPLWGGSASTTRGAEAARLVAEVLATLQDTDVVAVVAYGLDTPSGVEVLGDGRRMATATPAALAAMLARLGELTDSASLANPGDALDTAFDLFDAGARGGGVAAACNRAILLLSGSPAGATRCEAACAAAPPSTPCACTAGVLARVGARQAALAASAGRSALVAAVTLGDTADDSLLRQTSCAPRSQGVWTHMAAAGESIATTLGPFYRLLSSSRWSSEPPAIAHVVASRPYADAGGFGPLASLLLPIYGPKSRALLGLAGADVKVAELQAAAGGSLEAVQRELNRRAPQCGAPAKGGKPLALSGCQVQEARGDGHCAALADRDRRAWELTRYDCWVGTKNTVYVPYAAKQSRAAAAAWCASRHPNGTLAVIEDARDNALVSSLLDEDGTWLGLTRPDGPSGAASWAVDRPAGAGGGRAPGSAFRSWARAEPRARPGLTCAAADRRGAAANWVATDCDRPRPVLCSFPRAQLGGARLCAGTTLNLLERPVTVANVVGESNPGPGDSSPQCKAEAGGTMARPVCDRFTAAPLCPIGAASVCSNYCCPGCACRFDPPAQL